MVYPSVIVIVSYFNARDPISLISLLLQIKTIPSGHPFRVQLVVNVADSGKAYEIPELDSDISVAYRENIGYNIGAWEHGWRLCNESAFFIFLQDDCTIIRPGWVKAFLNAASRSNVGMVGESILAGWDRPWSFLQSELECYSEGHALDGIPATKRDVYFEALQRWNINPGERGDHLQSTVWGAHREILEAIEGFPIGNTYGEAIAAEIATSKKVHSLGMRTVQINWRPYSYVQHSQWLGTREIKSNIKRSVLRWSRNVAHHWNRELLSIM